MSGIPTAVVFGATGAQGGAVATSLLASGRWRARAVTRHPDRPAAQDLRRRGARSCAVTSTIRHSAPPCCPGPRRCSW